MVIDIDSDILGVDADILDVDVAVLTETLEAFKGYYFWGGFLTCLETTNGGLLCFYIEWIIGKGLKNSFIGEYRQKLSDLSL